MKKSHDYKLIQQIALLYVLGIMITGIITYFVQFYNSDNTVSAELGSYADRITSEVSASIKEYPAYEWLIDYWYEHSDELDIEYDAEFVKGNATEAKVKAFSELHPDIQVKYADTEEIMALPESDQKLYAEITYSWLITRVDEIKRAHRVDYLFCVVPNDDYSKQFILLSAADPYSVRGSNYEEVYTLGTTVAVSESQTQAMRDAGRDSRHLADAGDYVDYYVLLDTEGTRDVFIGMTFSLGNIRYEIKNATVRNTAISAILQFSLLLICLLTLYVFAIGPLRKVQKNIRLYMENKDSEVVISNLERIRPSNEIGQLSVDVSDLAAEIEDYTTNIRNITAEKERISTELDLASRIQASMLPGIFPPFPERHEFDIYASMDPAKEVGGDFYDFYLIDEDHLCILIADVSGKGIPASLFMMASKIILADNAKSGKNPAEILADANEAICANNKVDMFVTVWLGILEISSGRLTAANAGHEYPVVRRKDTGFEVLKDKHGFVIGGMEGLKYKEYEIALEPGDKIFLYTDGVPEASDIEGNMFGTDRMLKALNADTEASPESILANVRQSIDGFIQDAEQFDDLTMLCLEYKGIKTGQS